MSLLLLKIFSFFESRARVILWIVLNQKMVGIKNCGIIILTFSVKIAWGIPLLICFNNSFPSNILTTSYWKFILNTSYILVYSRHISLSPHSYWLTLFPSSWNTFACAFQKRYIKTKRCYVVSVSKILFNQVINRYVFYKYVMFDGVQFICVLLWFQSTTSFQQNTIWEKMSLTSST